MQNDNNNFNNQNEQPGGFNGQPGPGGYEYGPDEFNTGGFGQPPQNRIILESCYNLRRLAREALKGKWVMAAVAAFLVTVLLTIPGTIIDQLFGIEVPLQEVFQQAGLDVDLGAMGVTGTIKSSPLSGLYLILVAGPLEFGLTAYFLILFRRGKETLGDLFSGFEFFGKTLGLMLWITLWVILWALIPIAGPILAVVAGFRYAMAFMVQVDNPALPIRDCLNRSKFLMKGNKGKLFLLSLSFIGWYLLASVPGAILSAIAVNITLNSFVLIIVELIGSFVSAFVVAYVLTAYMAFYDMLIGRIYGESYTPGQF